MCPAFSIGKSKRDTLPILSDSPGPGSNQMNDLIRSSSTRSKLYNQVRNSISFKPRTSLIPHTKSTDNILSTINSKYGFSSDKLLSPGPAKYNPNYLSFMPKSPRQIFPRAGHRTFDFKGNFTGVRYDFIDLCNMDNPGPGEYSPFEDKNKNFNRQSFSKSEKIKPSSNCLHRPSSDNNNIHLLKVIASKQVIKKGNEGGKSLQIEETQKPGKYGNSNNFDKKLQSNRVSPKLDRNYCSNKSQRNESKQSSNVLKEENSKNILKADHRKSISQLISNKKLKCSDNLKGRISSINSPSKLSVIPQMYISLFQNSLGSFDCNTYTRLTHYNQPRNIFNKAKRNTLHLNPNWEKKGPAGYNSIKQINPKGGTFSKNPKEIQLSLSPGPADYKIKPFFGSVPSYLHCKEEI